jgi:hypothetical protein
MKQALYLLVLLIVYGNAHVLPHKLHLFRPDLIEVEIDSDVSVQAQVILCTT